MLPYPHPHLHVRECDISSHDATMHIISRTLLGRQARMVLSTIAAITLVQSQGSLLSFSPHKLLHTNFSHSPPHPAIGFSRENLGTVVPGISKFYLRQPNKQHLRTLKTDSHILGNQRNQHHDLTINSNLLCSGRISNTYRFGEKHRTIW